jgi:hypothetical protein
MVDATGPAPKLSLRAKIEQYDLAAPTALVLGHGALLLGLGTIAVDLSSSGSSFDQLAAQLAGKVVVGLPAGGKVAADVPALAALAAGTRPEVGWASLGRGSSSLDRFDAKLTVAGRQVAVDSIKARSGALSLAGSGKLDLTNQTLDARLGIWRGELPAASQAQPPVPTLHISGPWQSPLVRPVDRTSKAEAAPMPAMGAAQKPATAR